MKVKEFIKTFNQLEDVDKNKIIERLKVYDILYFEKEYSLNRKYLPYLVKEFNLNLGPIKFWYTDGSNNLHLPANAYIPEGYKKGRTNAFSKTTKGMHWITDGNINKLISCDAPLPQGFHLGTCSPSTKGWIWVNNGVQQKFVDPNLIPEGFIYKGKLDITNYIRAASKRKKYYYNNGKKEIKLLESDIIPEGYTKGRLPKLTASERIKKRDDYYDSLGYIAVKNLTHSQLIAYVFYRDKTNDLKDIIYKADEYTYVNKKYLPMFDEYSKINHSKGVSGMEDLFYNYLTSIYKGTILRHERSILKNENEGKKFYELDFYLPELKIGIEFNGIYWHSELQKDKNYHFDKSKAAEKEGIRLINIYEDEWFDPNKNNKIKLMLQIALGSDINKIYARQCNVRKIDNKEAKILNSKYHLQGHRNAQVTYGLFYKKELVQLMSFSKTKYNRNLKNENSWEIIRGCPGGNNLVVGGVSKLFNHFIKDYNPNEIFSYCDFNKFNGKSYEAIGMKFIGYTGPDMYWIIDGIRVPRNPMKHKELKEKASFKLWGSGSKKYLWTKN